MHGIAVTILSEDRERLSILQQRVEGTQMGRTVFGHAGFPASPTDTLLRQLQDLRGEIVLVDIDPANAQRAIHAIELIHSTTDGIAIFAAGEMSRPETIVAAMRAGAREYIDRGATSEAL